MIIVEAGWVCMVRHNGTPAAVGCKPEEPHKESHCGYKFHFLLNASDKEQILFAEVKRGRRGDPVPEPFSTGGNP